MRTTPFVVSVLAVGSLALLASCAQPSSREAAMSHGHHDTKAALEDGGPEPGVCPVMGNEVPEDAASDPELVAVYEGERYTFCCPQCKPKFLADPEKYISKSAE